MASITIPNSQINLVFAHKVREMTGAEVEETTTSITISNSPLVIPRYCLDNAIDPEGHRQARTSAWRSLILNRTGYAENIDDNQIVLTDVQPEADGGSRFSLRFSDDPQLKKRAEALVGPALHHSLNDLILAAIRQYVDDLEAQISHEGAA